MYHGSQEYSIHLSCETSSGLYASPALDITSSDDIVKLEKVQRQAARFVQSNYTERNPGCVTRMVKDLGWETLASRRKKDRLTTLYKIQHGAIDMDTGYVLRFNDRFTRGQQRLYHPTTKVTVYKNSFFPRTIQDWNRLPAAVTDSQTDHRGVQSRPRSPAADSQKLRDNHVF